MTGTGKIAEFLGVPSGDHALLVIIQELRQIKMELREMNGKRGGVSRDDSKPISPTSAAVTGTPVKIRKRDGKRIA